MPNTTIGPDVIESINPFSSESSLPKKADAARVAIKQAAALQRLRKIVPYAKKALEYPPSVENRPAFDRNLVASLLLAIDPDAKVSEVGAEASLPKGTPKADVRRATNLAAVYSDLVKSGVNDLSKKQRGAYMGEFKTRWEEAVKGADAELRSVVSKTSLNSEYFRPHLVSHERTMLDNLQNESDEDDTLDTFNKNLSMGRVRMPGHPYNNLPGGWMLDD